MSRRTLLPAVIGALAVVANLSMLIADAQVAEEPAAPQPQVVEATPQPQVSQPAPKHGMSVTTEDGRAHTELGVTTVNVVTEECVTGEGAETRLGLMNNSAIYGHCD